MEFRRQVEGVISMSEIKAKAASNDDFGERRTSSRGTTQITRALLACGVAVGPLFYLLVAIQMVIRPGYDIRRHPISLLSLGDLGWIQITNFLVTGLLALAFAIGLRNVMRGSRGGVWAPIFIGLYGLGTITAGVFHPDPAFGFPPGAPVGTLPTISAHAAMHGIGFVLASASLMVATFIFARRYFSLGNAPWGWYCLATGVVTPILVILGMAVVTGQASILFAVVGILAFGWVSAIAVQLLRSTPGPTNERA
jgi:Protein of unknown function (DUF998)